jgi:hypothetical protein
MAWAEKASMRASSSTFNNVDSGTLAFPNNVAQDDFLVVAGAVWQSGSAPTGVTVTDTRGTSYSVVLGAVPGSLTWRLFVAYGFAPGAGSCTVTVNPAGGTASFSFGVNAFTGGDTGSQPDVDGATTFSAGAGTTISDSITTAVADALIIGVMSHDGADVGLSADSPATQFAENEVNSNNQCFNAAFRIVTTAASYTMAWTLAASRNDRQAQTVSFKPATGGAVTNPGWAGGGWW